MKQQHSGQTRGRVVVIGAGIGGLAAAVRLAHAGLDVTVVETRSGPGGKMRTVPSAAGPIDAGPTVLTMRHVFDDLFTAAGTQLEDHLHLTAQPILARHWWPDGSTLDLHAGPIPTGAAIGSIAGPQAAAGRLFGVGEHLVGHPVGRYDLGLVDDAEVFEHLDRLRHRRPVARRAHHHTDDRQGVCGVAHRLLVR